MDLYCLYVFLDVMGTLGCLELRFLYQKYDFRTSGLMNARLSMHCSLKRTKLREDNSVRLRVCLRDSIIYKQCHTMLIIGG